MTWTARKGTLKIVATSREDFEIIRAKYFAHVPLVEWVLAIWA